MAVMNGVVNKKLLGGPESSDHQPEDEPSPGRSEEKGDENTVRGNWSTRIDFLFSCIAYSVGLGNIWRFPYLCMRNGGGAFLIPYFIFLFLGGIPLFYMELAIGQFSSLSPLAVWKCCPLFKGLGWSLTIVSCFFSIYYQVIVTWVIYYLGMSFQSPLPWANCNNTWNTANCRQRVMSNDSNYNRSSISANSNETSDATYFSNFSIDVEKKMMTPAEEFWQYNTLELTNSIDDAGGLRWQLAICHMIGWLVVFLCLIKGVKSSGKVVYVTATAPYVFLLVLLIRGVTLPGSSKGIIYYLRPDFSKLKEFRIWAEACMQIFYSLGTAWGGIITMASYNRFHNNIFRDAMIVPFINCFTSFFSGFVIFSIIGFMANEAGLPVEKVISAGPGLAFIAYPEALTHLPFSPIWAVLFFIMLLTVGLDTQFATVETLVSGVVDEFPGLFRKRKTYVILGVIVCQMLIGFTFCSRAGIYHFQIWDWYSGAFSVMIFAILECVIIMYIYGGNRFLYDIKMMLGYSPGIGWKILLGGITPILLGVCFAYAVAIFDTPYYGSYEYPSWAIGMGWSLSFCSLAPIPLFMIYRLATCKGTLLQRFQQTTTPVASWGPAVEKNRKGYRYLNQNLVDVEMTLMQEKEVDANLTNRKVPLNCVSCPSQVTCGLSR